MPITSSVPSYASEVFPWVKFISAEQLYELHSESQFVASLPYLGSCSTLFAIYCFMLYLVRGNQSLKLQILVFGCGAAFLISLIVAPIMLSSDLYAYAYYGRLLSVHGADAYADNSSLPASDPFLHLFGHTNPSIYGPLWNLISGGLTYLSGTRIGLTVLLFRGAAITAVLAGGGLLLSSLRRYSPERATQGLVFFLWSPLVIIETGLSAHNDTAMAALVLLCIWLHLRGYRSGAVAALTLSAWVKFVTGPLVPLYLLMALRESKSWRDRGWLLLRSTVGAGLASALIFALAHARDTAPTAQYANAPDFYANNFHELIFKGIRRVLGEDAESVQNPIYFTGWWLKPKVEIKLLSAPDEKAAVVATLGADKPLLTITSPASDWYRVYDPVSGKKGYIDGDDDKGIIDEINEPAGMDADPVIAQLESCAMEWPTVLKANTWIRATMGILFAAFGLLAAWRTSNFHRFLVWAPAVIIAMYFSIMTQIWPWYLIWALALCAFRPGELSARLAVALSAGVMTLYMTIGFAGSDPTWVYSCRSILAIVIPALSIGFIFAAKKRRRRIPKRNPGVFDKTLESDDLTDFVQPCER